MVAFSVDLKRRSESLVPSKKRMGLGRVGVKNVPRDGLDVLPCDEIADVAKHLPGSWQ